MSLRSEQKSRQNRPRLDAASRSARYHETRAFGTMPRGAALDCSVPCRLLCAAERRWRSHRGTPVAGARYPTTRIDRASCCIYFPGTLPISVTTRRSKPESKVQLAIKEISPQFCEHLGK